MSIARSKYPQKTFSLSAAVLNVHTPGFRALESLEIEPLTLIAIFLAPKKLDFTSSVLDP